MGILDFFGSLPKRGDVSPEELAARREAYRQAYQDSFLARNRDSKPSSVQALEDYGEYLPLYGDATAFMEAGGLLSEGNRKAAALVAAGGLLGVVPGAGDIVARPLIAAGRKAADIANRIEIDPSMVGSMGGNLKLRPIEKTKMRGSDYFDSPMENSGRQKDPAMVTPFSVTKHKTAPSNWEVEGQTLGQNYTPEIVTPSQQQGTRMFFAAGDRTAGDVQINRVGKVNLRRPVVLSAGAEYMDTGNTWASHSSVMKPKQNVLGLLSQQSDENIGLAFMPMGERSGDFAKHQAELYAEMLYSSNLPNKSKTEINNLVKDIYTAQKKKEFDRSNAQKKKNGLKPLKKINLGKIPSVSSEDFRDWFASQSAEGVRKPFLQAMDKSTPKALEGVPDVGEARFAATNPSLIQSDSYSTGFRFGSPDIKKGLLSSDHPSYDTKYAAVPGTTSQTYGYQVPWTIGARDTALPRLAEAAKGKGSFSQGQNDLFEGRITTLPSDQRVFTMNPKTNQILDQQYVDEASTYGDIIQNEGKARADVYNRELIDTYLRGL